MLNVLWPALIVIAILCGALAGRLDAVAASVLDSARAAVDVTIGLLGAMVLWLGLVRVLEAGGFIAWLGRAMRPLFRRLFPEVPPDHPAMGFMVLNVA
jgi:spore maturation protein A